MPFKDPAAAKAYWIARRQTPQHKERQERWRVSQLAWRRSPEGRDIYYDSNLRKLYGITIHDYNQMLASQGDRCAICRTHQSELAKRLHVDHCHNTGIVRGLLCAHCNHALGKLRDDPALLRTAAEYLEVPREPPPPLPNGRLTYGSRRKGGELHLSLADPEAEEGAANGDRS